MTSQNGMVFLIALILAAAMTISAIASPESGISWLNGYRHPGSIIHGTRDGGYVLAGGSSILKIRSHGAVDWQSLYNFGSKLFRANDVKETPEGYIATGLSSSVDQRNVERVATVMRLDTSGNVVWSKHLKGSDVYEGTAIVATRREYVVAGSFRSADASGARMWLFRLGGGGHIIQQDSYAASRPTSIEQSGNGDVLVGTEKLSVLRVSAEGSSAGLLRWQKKYPVEDCCRKSVLRATPDGGFFLGAQQLHDQGYFLVIRADSYGKVLFSKQYFDNQGLAFADLSPTSDGGCVLLARSFIHPAKATIIKTDAQGNVQWTRAYFTDTGEHLSPQAILQAPDQGYVFTSFFGWVMKLDSSGKLADSCRNIVRAASAKARDISIPVENARPYHRVTKASTASQGFKANRLRTTVEVFCDPDR